MFQSWVRLLLAGQWQIESKGGALAGAFAVDAQLAAHFLGGKGAAMQAEAVSVLAGGEAMGEDAV